MNRFGLEFHHLGLAVGKPDEAFLYLKSLGYVESKTVYDPLQSVNLAMYCHADMPDVEVIWPAEGPSPIDEFIKRGSTRLYHLCYTSTNVDAALQAMEAAGLNVLEVSPPKPAVLFGGQRASFYSVMNVGLIEVIEVGRPAAATAG